MIEIFSVPFLALLIVLVARMFESVERDIDEG